MTEEERKEVARLMTQIMTAIKESMKFGIEQTLVYADAEIIIRPKWRVGE